jgi:hypothetical protein
MKSRQEILEEQLLRENIRKAIRIVKNKKLQEEKYIRSIVKSIINEAEKYVYDYTSMNKLRDLFTDVIAGASETSNTKFKTEYMSLTSDPSERQKFVQHILDMANADFQRLEQDGEVQTTDSDFAEQGYKEEEDGTPLKISVGDLAASGKDIVEPESEEEENAFEITDDIFGESPMEEESEDDSTLMSARTAYATIAPALQSAWNASPTDKPVRPDPSLPPGIQNEGDLFKHFFNENIKLFANKFEKEIPAI